MECIAIINQKGGVGKTATTVNLGAALAQRGKRILVIDMDPQGHSTTHLGLDAIAKGAGIYEVLTDNLPLESATHPYSPMISVVPAQIDLAAAEVELVSVVGREVILRDALARIAQTFDIVVLDCPPSLGVLTLNALSAATHVLIPVQPHFLALQGVGKLFETIKLVGQRLNTRLRVAGLVMCMHEAATRLATEVVDDMTTFLEASRNTPVPWSEAKLFDTRIRRNVKLAECPSYGQSIFEYAPRSNGAIDYLALADELLISLRGPIIPTTVDVATLPTPVNGEVRPLIPPAPPVRTPPTPTPNVAKVTAIVPFVSPVETAPVSATTTTAVVQHAS